MVLPDAPRPLMNNARLFIDHLQGRGLLLLLLLRLLLGDTQVVRMGRSHRLGGEATSRMLVVLHVLLKRVTMLVMHRLVQTCMRRRRRGSCCIENLCIRYTLREVVLVVNATAQLLGHLGSRSFKARTFTQKIIASTVGRALGVRGEHHTICKVSIVIP